MTVEFEDMLGLVTPTASTDESENEFGSNDIFGLAPDAFDAPYGSCAPDSFDALLLDVMQEDVPHDNNHIPPAEFGTSLEAATDSLMSGIGTNPQVVLQDDAFHFAGHLTTTLRPKDAVNVLNQGLGVKSGSTDARSNSIRDTFEARLEKMVVENDFVVLYDERATGFSVSSDKRSGACDLLDSIRADYPGHVVVAVGGVSNSHVSVFNHKMVLLLREDLHEEASAVVTDYARALAVYTKLENPPDLTKGMPGLMAVYDTGFFEDMVTDPFRVQDELIVKLRGDNCRLEKELFTCLSKQQETNQQGTPMKEEIIHLREALTKQQEEASSKQQEASQQAMVMTGEIVTLQEALSKQQAKASSEQQEATQKAAVMTEEIHRLQQALFKQEEETSSQQRMASQQAAAFTREILKLEEANQKAALMTGEIHRLQQAISKQEEKALCQKQEASQQVAALTQENSNLRETLTQQEGELAKQKHTSHRNLMMAHCNLNSYLLGNELPKTHSESVHDRKESTHDKFYGYL
jgi:hypothetical protein